MGRSLTRQFVTFTSVGVIGTTGHYVTLFLLVRCAGFSPVIASTAGFVVGAVINYGLNYRITFSSRNPHHQALPKFLTVAAIGLGINVGALRLMMVWLGLHYMLAQLAATVLVLLWNFSANKVW